MITLPKNVEKLIYSVGKNAVWRCYGQEEISIDNTISADIKNKKPFIVEQNGRRILFTSNPEAIIPDDCPYAVLVKRMPTGPQFIAGDLVIIRWLKHPLMNDSLSPDDVAKTWRGSFTYIEEDREARLDGLRQPQAGAIHSWLASKKTRKDRAIIVMPTGTGKTETMLGIMVTGQCKKLLVTVPSDALRDQISEKFITLGKLHEFNIVTKECKNPYVAIINSGLDNVEDWRQILDRSNVIVTTMALLVKIAPDVKSLLSNTVTNVFVDEAHHVEAKTWSEFFDTFDRTKITQFTATPFRNDGKKLKGEYVYTFTLRAAQQQGYYQKINFCPVYELERENADKEIAKEAVKILREDREVKRKDHFLMARCKDTTRAEEVYQYYREYEEYNPIVIHSKTPNKEKKLEEIKNGEHQIIVCVNMLGEGFDLPQLKVAAIHDEKQSLPITLQFIGRFTRTARNIGEASFVTNMAYPPMADDVRNLYLKDADWNFIIPGLNDKATEEQQAFTELLNDFPDLHETDIPFQSINPALSTVIYRLDSFVWNTDNWKEVFTERDFDYRYGSVNEANDMMIIILGSIEGVDWTNYEGIQNRSWNVILLHKYDAGNYKHLYINSSFSKPSFDKLVKALFGAGQEKLSGDIMFRSFHGMSRLLVQIFGGRKAIAGDLSFKSYVGPDVENGLKKLEQGTLIQNNIFASGIINGERTTHGCSKSGKIWSYRRGNLHSFKGWSHRIGALVEDPTIRTNEIFKHTLKVDAVASPPQSVPISIDWDDDIYKNARYNQTLQFEGSDEQVYIFDTAIELTERQYDDINNLPSDILFQITYKGFCTRYRISYASVQNDDKIQYSYRVEKLEGPSISFKRGYIPFGDIVDYFNKEKRSPVFFFANGSMLYANNLVQLREEVITPYSAEDLIGYNFIGDGVSIGDESMDWPHKPNTIQYYMWQRINDDYELLFDDDGSGEVADLIGIRQDVETIYVDLYHLKFAQDNRISKRIDNFYAVCGQAEKSLKWRNGDMNIFKRLIYRTTHTVKAENRILKGDVDLLKQWSQEAGYTKKVKFHLHIVQPGLSKADAPADILHLLGVVQNYAFEVCNSGLTVHCSM